MTCCVIPKGVANWMFQVAGEKDYQKIKKWNIFSWKCGKLTSFYQIFQINLLLWLTIQNITVDKPQNPNSQQPLGIKPKFKNGLMKKNLNTMERHNVMPLQKSQENVISKKFEIEDLIIRFCKSRRKTTEVLRLPAGHSESNPKELIRALLKSDVVRKNKF